MGVTSVLGGADITSLVLEGSVTKQHNRPSFSTIRVPSDQTTADGTAKLKVYLDGVLDFHGICVMIEDQGDEDSMYSTFTFADPSVLLEMRPARDGVGSGDRGDFSKPSFMTRNTTGPAMLSEILTQTMNLGDVPADAEGPLPIELGTFESGGADLRGMPADWPMTISEVITMLTETGEVDVRCDPIDAGGNIGRFSAWNRYGSDLSASVRFEYQTGSYNARAARRSLDYSTIMNKLWIYLGPRVKTKADPAGDQHWAMSVTGSDAGNFPNPPYNQVIAARDQSRLDYYPRMHIRIFDGDESALIHLYRRWWLMESWLRYKPKQIVAITPNRGIRPAFTTGDKIYVAAGSKLRGGFSGTQRVMEYTYRWDENGVVELGEPVGAPGVPSVHTTADVDY